MRKNIVCLLSVLAMSLSASAKDVVIPFNPENGETKTYEGTVACEMSDSGGEMVSGTVNFSVEASVSENASGGFTVNPVLKGFDEIRFTENSEEMVITSEEIRSYIDQMWSKFDEYFAGLTSGGDIGYAYVSGFAENLKKKVMEISAGGINVNLNPAGRFVSITEYDNFIEAFVEFCDYLWTNVAYEYLSDMAGDKISYLDFAYGFVREVFFSSENFKRIYKAWYSPYFDFYGNEYELNKSVPHVVRIPLFAKELEISYACERKVVLNMDKNICVIDKYIFTKADLLNLVKDMMEKSFDYVVGLMYREDVYEFFVHVSGEDGMDYETYCEFLQSVYEEEKESLISEFADSEQDLTEFSVSADITRILDAKTGRLLGFKCKGHADINDSEFEKMDITFEIKEK